MTAHGKGTLAVTQMGGPTAVVNASLAGVLEAAGELEHIGKVLGLVHGLEAAWRREFVEFRRISAGELQLLVHTPGAILGSSRHKLSTEDYARAIDSLKAHEVRHFICIGGDGSMQVCSQLADQAESQGYELQVIGVPKTIDNDVPGTDHTPGYGSAARFVAMATHDAGRDLEAMKTFDDVTILETLGRNTGWLAAASALAKETDEDAPHLVFVPEIGFDDDAFLQSVSQTYRRFGRAFVVVSEGLIDGAGRNVGLDGSSARATDAAGRPIMSLTPGPASYLADQVREKLGLRARSLRPSLVGRTFSACVSSLDREEALEAGRLAVGAIADGLSGKMVSIQRQSQDPYFASYGFEDLSEVAGIQRPLPTEFIDRSRSMIADAFRSYALPLIDGPLPQHARLAGLASPVRAGHSPAGSDAERGGETWMAC